jgi:AraC-like DNA-binding protein
MKETPFDEFVPKIDYHVFRKCNPNWHLRPHFVERNDLTYVIKGKAHYTINGKDYEMGPGDIIFLTEGVEKKAVSFPQNLMQCYSINFTSYPGSKYYPPPFPLFSHIGLKQDIINLFRELTICWSRQESGYIMRSRALLMLILHRLSEILIYDVDCQTGDYRINKATRIIALHYPDKLTVNSLAKQVQLNTVYFGRLFKHETGVTVHQYIIRIRVRNAENMLQSGNYKVHEVAEHCGFSDVVHFYKSFRAILGFPPSRCMPKGTSVLSDLGAGLPKAGKITPKNPLKPPA